MVIIELEGFISFQLYVLYPYINTSCPLMMVDKLFILKNYLVSYAPKKIEQSLEELYADLPDNVPDGLSIGSDHIKSQKADGTTGISILLFILLILLIYLTPILPRLFCQICLHEHRNMNYL